MAGGNSVSPTTTTENTEKKTNEEKRVVSRTRPTYKDFSQAIADYFHKQPFLVLEALIHPR